MAGVPKPAAPATGFHVALAGLDAKAREAPHRVRIVRSSNVKSRNQGYPTKAVLNGVMMRVEDPADSVRDLVECPASRPSEALTNLS